MLDCLLAHADEPIKKTRSILADTRDRRFHGVGLMKSVSVQEPSEAQPVALGVCCVMIVFFVLMFVVDCLLCQLVLQVLVRRTHPGLEILGQCPRLWRMLRVFAI